MNARDMERLETNINKMEAMGREFGLDFYEMRYEVCPADVIYAVGSYGMPTRFSHWSFGKQFYRQKLDYDLGLSRIYELVVNSNPCYAFLLDVNSVLQNETVVAHVLGHCDFFKKNAHFAHTNRNMVESMAVTADRFRSYEMKYGRDKVEAVLDAALAVWEHVDASYFALSPHQEVGARNFGTLRPDEAGLYKDILLYLVERSPVLSDWQRDVLATIREESLYFWPQMETKIMNEGWATYWHQHIMEALDLSEEDSLEFAKMHSGVVIPSRTRLNPYYLGLKMWEDIEKRFGKDFMFEVRETDNDVSFIRNYLTQDLVDELDLYVYAKKGDEWVVVEKDYRAIRKTICDQRTNAGFPVIQVQETKDRSQDLTLVHAHEGIDLDMKYAEKTLPYVARLWGHPVNLHTVLDGRKVTMSCDGGKTTVKNA